MKQRAFTLMELLVVIAIIALLAGILFPVFSTAKAKGRQVACMSNMRQISQAQILYASDNADAFITGTPRSYPYSDNRLWWVVALEPYGVNESLHCPGFEAAKPVSWRSTGYATNGCLDAPGEVGDPSRLVLMAEIANVLGRKGAANEITRIESLAQPDVYAVPEEGPIASNIEKPYGAQRHNGGSTYTCVDGHAAWKKPEAIRRTPGYLGCSTNADHVWVGPETGLSFTARESGL